MIVSKLSVSCPNLLARAMKPIAELLTTLQNLSNDELLPVARAFSQFLNLANTAEQYHSISPNGEAASNPEVIARTLRKLKDQPNLNEDTIKKAVESLSLELVLTAHPTEITRRTLIHKMVEVNNCLKQLDNKDIADYEHNQLMRRLRQLIAQSSHTDEIRKHRPSPVDEAKWGFAVVENSLWEGVPNYLRELNEQLEANLGYQLPVDFVPVRFTSRWAATVTATRTSPPISPATCCCSAAGKRPICS